MTHSYTWSFHHIVFSTKKRKQLFPEDLLDRVWAYLGGIAQKYEIKTWAIGGRPDHVHILASVPVTLTLSRAVQLLKSNSSKWLTKEIPGQRNFAWQEGYSAFSIGIAQIKTTIAYIARQKEHHRKRTFEEEYLAFLKKHEIQFDPRFVLG